MQDQTTRDQESEIDLGTWEISEILVREYTGAVGDPLPLYFDCRSAPPLALSAWALGRLLDHLNLPPGAIHSLQEMEALRAVKFGEHVRALVEMSKPRRRGGMEFITATLSVFSHSNKGDSSPEGSGPRLALTGKTTVMVPAPPEGLAGRPSQPAPEVTGRESIRDGQGSLAGHLPVVERTISQQQLDSYAKASGDFNPLHLDPEFAATTQFGGIIAHGMLTLALVSENMAAAFGEDWLASGGLRVRFKGAAYVGDRLATRCRVTEQLPGSLGEKTKCSVAVVNRENGQELAAGSASVLLTPV